jgi:Ca2+-binding EF-hand superfamily protein
MKFTVASTVLTLALAGAAFAQQGNPGAHFVQNWDQDGDGAVSLEEARTKRGDLFISFDTDADDKLSPEEYAAFDEMRAADQEQMREEMAGMGNGQGKGNGKGMGMGMMQAEGGMMRAFNDPDGDGMVSREDFVGRTADWFAMMDRDGDGKVTVDDFGR